MVPRVQEAELAWCHELIKTILKCLYGENFILSAFLFAYLPLKVYLLLLYKCFTLLFWQVIQQHCVSDMTLR